MPMGLRDAGFEILNTFGCTCSIDHIRQHGEYWTQQRKACDELQPTQFWRVTIDNLNFKRKFAKNLTEGGNTPQKMLNLLTGQVTYTTSTETFLNDPTPYREKTRVSEYDFLVDETNGSEKNLKSFNQTVYKTTLKRLEFAPTDCSESLIESFHEEMPNWTPPTGDKVTFATELQVSKQLVGVVESRPPLLFRIVEHRNSVSSRNQSIRASALGLMGGAVRLLRETSHCAHDK